MKILILILAFSLTGCIGLGSRESSVTYPDGKIYKIKCQSDGMIDFSHENVKIKVDNRGPTGQVWAAGTAALGKTYETVKGAVTEAK